MTDALLQELACSRISDLVDQMVQHQINGDEVKAAILDLEIRDLTEALDQDDDFFYTHDHRTLNQ